MYQMEVLNTAGSLASVASIMKDVVSEFKSHGIVNRAKVQLIECECKRIIACKKAYNRELIFNTNFEILERASKQLLSVPNNNPALLRTSMNQFEILARKLENEANSY